MTTTTQTPGTVDQLWYTRCPVPTASGIAHRLGWLDEEFAADGLALGVLQDAPPELAGTTSTTASSGSSARAATCRPSSPARRAPRPV